jgi:cytochrome c oxidase accessory protein FixG
MPWNAEKIRKKSLKAVIFYALSFFISNLFLAYIIGSDELFKIISEPISDHAAGFAAIVLFSGVFFFVFWWFREQACTFVCPYGRLQSVLIDKSTIVVAYDYKRGEKREKFKKKGQSSDAGDCIDCHKCEQVCPTGIDIKDGIQLECINCTACMDACDEVMVKVGRPKGLIRYASLDQIENGQSKVVTPRIVLYSVLLTGLIVLLTVLMMTRENIDTTILREKGTQALLIGDDMTRNIYSIKYINKSNDNQSFTIRPAGLEGNIIILGVDNNLIEAEPNSVNELKFLFDVPVSELDEPLTDIQFEILDEEGNIIESKKANYEKPSVLNIKR